MSAFVSALGWCGISGLPDRVFGLYMLSGDLISSLMLQGGGVCVS